MNLIFWKGNMNATIKTLFILVIAICCLGWSAQAKEVVAMYGGVIIDGYDFANDIGPKGSIAYDEEKHEFRGSYNGLKMPKGRRAIFAWLHDTVNQKTEYLGPVGWLKVGTAGKNKGRFVIPVPDKYQGGDFGSFEIIGFTAENTGLLDGGKVVEIPKEPSGSAIQVALKPAFYLFAALPGADTQKHYCGHGQDFFYAKAPEKQTCYDWLCSQKYSSCKAAGVLLH